MNRRHQVRLAGLAVLGVVVGWSTAANAEAYGTVYHSLAGDRKSASGYAAVLGPFGADFRVSAACSGPDRHSDWEDEVYVTKGTGKCLLWQTASYSYYALRE